MKPVHEEIGDLLSGASDDPLASPVEARRKAMDFLARREYGRTELVSKLARKGFAAETAEAAVERLAAEGLQSDRRFAENFVVSRTNQGKGPVRIRVELAQRGIADTAIAEALEAGEVDWKELARSVRAKKFGRRRPSDFKEKARQMRFLQYRGFEPEQVRAAMGDDGE